MPCISSIAQRKSLFIFTIYFLIIFIFPNITFAQSVSKPASNSKDTTSSVQGAATFGIARIVETKEKNIKDGSVISSSQKGAVRSTIPYDAQVLGVVSPDAA